MAAGRRAAVVAGAGSSAVLSAQDKEDVKVENARILDYNHDRDGKHVKALLNQNTKKKGILEYFFGSKVANDEFQAYTSSKNHTIKVCYEGNTFVGFVVTLNETSIRRGLIECMVVRHDFCNKGYGEQLVRVALDHLRDRFKGLRLVRIYNDHSSKNYQANAMLFEKMGFKVYYTSNGCDALDYSFN